MKVSWCRAINNPQQPTRNHKKTQETARNQKKPRQPQPTKPTQTKPNPIGDRTGKLVEQENTSCSREIVGKCLQEELGSSDRTGKPVKCEDNRVMNVHDRTGKPVESSTHTQCKNLVLPDIVILHRQTRTSSTLQSMRKTSTSTSQACRTRW